MPRKKYYRKNEKQVRIAKERINFLFREAKKHFKKDSSVSDKYVRLARRIAMKYKVRLAPNLKKQLCKHCHKFIVPGANCRVRLHKHRVIYYCLGCKHYMRHPVK